ncbi:UDP-glucosyltransferase 2-like [Lasioglossum baleicum]|uniref:UDP-glucosyltransferase 2-like n=1 Tax=Lasioglossum baleicum TaxID=434251 RepID=UPI003FCD5D66
MSVSRFRWVLLCTLVLLACCSANVNEPERKLRILGVFAHLGKSHFDVFKPLLEELARRGHDVTVLSYFPRTEKAKAAEPLPNYKDINLVTKELSVFINVVNLRNITHPSYRVINDMLGLSYMAQLSCNAGLNHTRVKEFVAAGEKFDLVITENFNTRCFYAVFHQQAVPFIEVSTHQLMPWVYTDLGFSSEASYQPSMFSTSPMPMNLRQRMWNAFADVLATVIAETMYRWRDQSLMEKYYGPGVPDLKEMSGTASLMFVNTHFTLHGAQPHPPNVIEVGGLHISGKINPLPKDIKKFLDEAREGVLYFNFGSMVKAATMPEDKLTVLLNVLASLPRKVIWKWETDEFTQKPDNVLVKKWLPQFDILSSLLTRVQITWHNIYAVFEVVIVRTSPTSDRAGSSTMTESRSQWILLCALALLACCSANVNEPERKLKILGVFPHPGKSHFDVFKPLLEELARRSHDLTVISYFPRSEKAKAAEPLPNYKDISLVTDKEIPLVNIIDLHIIVNPIYKIIMDVSLLNYMVNQACEVDLNNTRVKEFVAAGEKYDLVITESFNTNCFYAVFHQQGVPFIEVSTHYLMPSVFRNQGFSSEASYKPCIVSISPRPMNFRQRMWNVLIDWFSAVVANTVYRWRDQRLMQKHYGPDVPDLSEMVSNASLVLVNTHFSLHGPHPHPPNVIEVGGLHISQKVNPLPEDIQKFLDEATEGVLYLNFGSVIKAASMPEDKLTVLLNVLASLPRKVIWKWETDEFTQKPDNVLVKKWLPQFDILNHPNVKCYFGHGGLLGLSEGVYSGVPMVLMPFYGDQHLNAMAAKARGVAEVVEFTELTEQNLRHALDEVFNNTKYSENARRLSKAFRDRPATPLETAVWWTEYIGRGNGLPYVKSEASTMPWYVRNLVDVMAAFAAIGFVTLYVIYRVAKRLLCSGKKTKGHANHYANSKKTN